MSVIEDKIIEQLDERFPFLAQRLISPSPRRIVSPPLPRAEFEEVFAFVTGEGGFSTFHLVIGTDDGDDLGFYYVLSSDDKTVLLLKQSAPKSAPVIQSVCETFPNALWHERELVDLFGAVVEGLPPGPTYPLPDGWPEGNFPMRKEWKTEYFDHKTMTYNPPAGETKKEAGNE